MQTHAIVEIEEGSLSVVVGARVGKATRVLKSQRVALADLNREAVTQALRSLAGDVLQGARGVHVILGERRVLHFSSTVPKMGATEMASFVVREALRLTSLKSPDEVLATTRLVRSLPGHRHVLATTAVARAVAEPILAAFEQNQFQVLGLYSTETCMALAAPPRGSQPLALLECNAGRARFVLCDGPSPVQVRRFVISGAGEAGGDMLATQLAMELPRTFDWLREIGQELPRTMLLGTRVAIEDDSLAMLKGDEFQHIGRAQPGLAIDAEAQPPSLGASMLLRALALGEAPTSLLSPPRVVLPVGAGRLVTIAAALIAGGAMSWSAWVDFEGQRSLRYAIAQAELEFGKLQQQIADQKVQAPPPSAPSTDDAVVAAACAMRRPVSLLFAQVSNAAEPSVNLEELKFASADRIIVSGSVTGESRREALAVLATFGKRLRDIPFVKPDGQDDVSEVAGQRTRFRFKLGLAWRNP